MELSLQEVAARIRDARFCCAGRTMPCGSCTSMEYQGCIYLASAVLTEPEPTSAEIHRLME